MDTSDLPPLSKWQDPTLLTPQQQLGSRRVHQTFNELQLNSKLFENQIRNFSKRLFRGNKHDVVSKPVVPSRLMEPHRMSMKPFSRKEENEARDQLKKFIQIVSLYAPD